MIACSDRSSAAARAGMVGHAPKARVLPIRRHPPYSVVTLPTATLRATTPQAMTRRAATFVALALALGACSSSDPMGQGLRSAAEVVAATGDTSPQPDRGPDTEPSERPDVDSSRAAIIGSDSIGDPGFPGMGNGGYQVDHYALALTVDRPRIDGIATLTIIAEVPLDRFNLDLSGLTVESVLVDGLEAPFERSGLELTIDPEAVVEPGRDTTVQIRYGGEPETIADPAGPAPLGWYSLPFGTFVLSEPLGAPTWFPANDHPQDKATFEITVRAPSTDVAVAAGSLVDRVDNGDGTTSWVWVMEQPMATYLASVVTGSFTMVEEDPVGEVAIRHVLPTASVSELAPVAARQRAMIEFFVERFGPYPFDTYGIAVVPENLGFAALENQTLSLFDQRVFAPTTPADFVDRVMAHELAHQWFGNQVSPEIWDDIWLNEGFATWAEYHWFEVATGLDPWDDDASSYPPLKDLANENLFDTNVYVRGGLTLEALRREIGDTEFFDLLRQWLDRFGGGTASTDDFVDLVSERAGSEARELVESWIYDDTMPTLEP